MKRFNFRHIGIVLIGIGFILMATGNAFHQIAAFVLQEILGAALLMIGFIMVLTKVKNKPRLTEIKPIFVSELPQNVDWEENNQFLKMTAFYKHLLSDSWRSSELFSAYPISETSMDCLSCLHEDLSGCYNSTFAFDENGNEDRDEEYRLLREALNLKYGKIEEDNLNRIYCRYLQEDR